MYLKLAIFLFCIPSVYAGTTLCSGSANDIRLDDQFCELRDQDSVGWCYAFVGADLMSAKMNRAYGRKKCTDDISPISVANNYIKKHAPNERKKILEQMAKGEFDYKNDVADDEGGFVHESIISTLGTNYCTDKELPSEDTSWMKSDACKWCNIRGQINEMFADRFIRHET